MQGKLHPNDVSSYKNLIAMHAMQSWRKYPKNMQAKLHIEDMIQDGIVFAYHHIVPKWKPNACGVYVTSYLFSSLENFYYNEWMKFQYAKRNGEIDILSINPVMDGKSIRRGIVNRMAVAEDELEYLPEWMDQLHVHVVEVFSSIYLKASDSLKQSMSRWFLTNYHSTKVHTHGLRFKQDKKEFLKLAKKFEMDRMDCEILMSSNRCQEQVFLLLPENCVVNI